MLLTQLSTVQSDSDLNSSTRQDIANLQSNLGALTGAPTDVMSSAQSITKDLSQLLALASSGGGSSDSVESQARSLDEDYAVQAEALRSDLGAACVGKQG